MSQYLKELITDELKSRFDGVSDALLVDVIGMEVNSNVELRKTLREKNIKLMVVKNSLARRATEGSALAPAFEGAGGTIAVVWGGEDVVSLAKEVARDGEGATKLLEVTVEGATSVEDARLAARTVASSPLVKTAIHGADPNWGRVMMALGRSGAKIEERKLALYLNEFCVFDEGRPVPFYHEAARVSMKEPEVRIRANLRMGRHRATAWGCDLTEEYVRFNSEYST
ncbi:MAG: bifunctional ornithine acetyltransferase/N-acetylglutamate synthase [Planctomycetes bacterium]|nr:bifunctional ornithine acetyltransferase/N-acetylglutamate synthase [Planctomycetota bacterium]